MLHFLDAWLGKVFSCLHSNEEVLAIKLLWFLVCQVHLTNVVNH